jgi:hypothetical protein
MVINPMMKKHVLFLVFFALHVVLASGSGPVSTVKKIVVGYRDTTQMNFVRDPLLYSEGWDTLPQTLFWKEIINLTSDTCIINIADCRKPVDRICRTVWTSQTDTDKICFKDSICRQYGFDNTTGLNITAGKNEFYAVRKVIPDINTAIKIFRKNNCDPWYAQAILLIESPGRTASKSAVGANGPFQLMRSVAIKHGLRVNKHVDERTSVEKSARAAAGLINQSCIPYIKKYLDERCISYDEQALWFRLLVLHAYHAGAGNIRCVIDEINPAEGGVDLFRQVWLTTCRSFKNESQNYSQIALAALVNFDQLVNQYGDTVFLVQGDRLLRDYNRKDKKLWDTYEYLSRCMTAYENDLLSEMIPFDYFMKKIGYIRGELSRLARIVTRSEKDIVLKKYPSSEEHLTRLASELTKRKRYEDAIKLLKLNLDIYPESFTSADSIAQLYRITGDKKNAEFYSNRAGTLAREGSKSNE